MKIDKKIISKSSKWSFKNIADQFDMHILKSVPYYLEWQELICSLSENFINNKNNIFTEIGSSTGSLTRKLSNHHKKNDIKIYAYDIESSMVKKAKFLSKKNKNIKYLCKDITKINFKKSNCFISYYTIQFIPQKYRQELINKIYDKLEWGGAFFLFEKIRGKDARFQDYFLETYNDFKSKNGFSELEIMNKTKSLKGVLDPFSSKGNESMLKRAGFVDSTSIAQWNNFKGWLAIK